MKTAVISGLLGLSLAAAMGVVAQGRPAGARSTDLTTPVSDAWYRSLPRDPDAATRAFLGRVPPEMRSRGEAMSRSRYWVLAGRVLFNVGGVLLFLFSGAAGALHAAVARATRSRPAQAVLFAFTLLAYVVAVTLPIEVYAGYTRYRQAGFADLAFRDWLLDYLTTWFVLTLFYAVGIATLMVFVRRRPRSWPCWAGVIYLLLGCLYNVVTPALIDPLTNHYSPLPETELKRDLLTMAHSAGVRVDDIYSKDASRQSRMLNAQVSGMFGSSRISIDDTTLAGRYFPAVKAVVAHEIGHYVNADLFKMTLFSSLVAALGFWLIAAVAPPLVGRFGRAWRVTRFDDNAGIAVLWLLFLAWGFASDPALNAYARLQEARADAYALDLSQAPLGLAEFMIHDADIARLEPTTLDVLLFHDHPTDASRVRNAMGWRAAHVPGH
jgi:STE24 endopeptidase